jgi:UDP-2,3-diacylglucosamine pyrophosphatase LpxH
MKPHRFLGAGFAAFVVLAIPAHGATERLTVFISDLHFSVGKSGGEWQAIEDFRWGTEFAAFIKAIDAEGRGMTDLVFNGDTFELWQSPFPHDCVVGRGKDEGCNEQEALARLEPILAAHSAELSLLKEFAMSKANHVFLVPGNHDAALLYPAIANRILRQIGAPADRVEILSGGFYLSGDKKIYADHGHQIDDTNRFPNWPQPFKDVGEERYLVRPWGEQFVQSFYNSRESKYSGIDNIAGELNGIKYGLSSEGVAGSLNAVGDFARFFLLKQSFRQFVDLLEDQKSDALPPQWNLDEIRSKGDVFLVESFPSDDPFREIAEAAQREGRLGVHLVDLDDSAVQRICDYRYSLLQTQLSLPENRRTIERCPVKNLRAIAKKVVSLVDEYRFISNYIDNVYDRLTSEAKLKGDEIFDLVIFSHTHQVDDFNPREGSHRDWQPRVMNTGAWQRIATLEYVRHLKEEKRWSNPQVLRELTLAMLPDCYPAVLVPPYGTAPKGELRYWRHGSDGAWTLSPVSCVHTQAPGH